MGKRVLLAGLFHETHTFVPGHTPLSTFRVQTGAEMWSARGDVSTLAGALEVADECGWDVIPVIDLDGGAGALVDDNVVEHFWDAFRRAAEREQPHGIDGVYLNLHGAMVSQSYDDVEGEIVQRIRSLDDFAEVLIGGVLDLHGNISPAMAGPNIAFVAYRENPHTDAKTAAMDGARVLDRLMRTAEPAATLWEHPPLLLPPTATGTEMEPMRALQAAARAIEAAHADILAINVFAGFSYADVADAGVSFTAVTVGDHKVARGALRELSALAMEHKHAALPEGISLDEALGQLRIHERGPVVLIEQADNIGGGAPGDLTFVLKGLVEHSIRNAGVIVNDAVAVAEIAALQPGQTTTLRFGGRSGAAGAEPVTLPVELVSTSDGSFTLEDAQSHLAVAGRTVNMGPCALVRSGGVTILLTSRPTPPFDLAQWRSQGVQPEELFVIAVKAAVAHRRAYDPIAAASYVLNTPGPCTADLRTLPFAKVARPVYPLDELNPDRQHESSA